MTLFALIGALLGSAAQPAATAPPAAAPSAPTAPVAVTLPQQISGQVTPSDYPKAARRAKAQGVTRARLSIDTTGRVTECLVVSSSGHEILDRRTCELALARMKFKPARDSAGGPVPVKVVLPVTWAIKETPPAKDVDDIDY